MKLDLQLIYYSHYLTHIISQITNPEMIELQKSGFPLEVKWEQEHGHRGKESVEAEMTPTWLFFLPYLGCDV